ncbi:MAG: hypothetical protein CL878_05990 [Dehalococcoidia bacterium]|nr:hypothetical protein [Dehalococcoidia bacterium]
MPKELFESELFGHEKGAFTGAVSDTKGLFRAAEGGTIFLDEVTEIPPEIQVKLLRVLQDKRIRPLGETEEIPVNVRVIAATNRRVERELDLGTLREDFFYRLSVIALRLPPLRDRPEDVETNPVTGRVYVTLTNNWRRALNQTNRANPRPWNRFGHIIEIIPPASGQGTDHAATECRWEMFLQAGNPSRLLDGARYHQAVSRDGWFGAPDNITFDSRGRMWITTDGAPSGDGLWACDTVGNGRALTKHFFRAPLGAEAAGPYFVPDHTALFVSVQHPGESSPSFEAPNTRWPDFDPRLPPRPSVVSIVKDDGGEVGA